MDYSTLNSSSKCVRNETSYPKKTKLANDQMHKVLLCNYSNFVNESTCSIMQSPASLNIPQVRKDRLRANNTIYLYTLRRRL